MEEYFKVMGKLIEALSQILDESDQNDEKITGPILDKMANLASADPRIKPQISDVKYYRSTIQSLFKAGMSSGYRWSFYEILRRDKAQLEAFALANNLFK